MSFRLCLVLGAAALIHAQNSTLQSELTGIEAVFPSDSRYPGASAAYNLRYTYKPAVVAYPTSIDQVSHIVAVGAAHNFSVVARSGGHSYIAAGLGGDNAIVIDLSKNKEITVQNDTGVATIQTGNRLGDVAQSLWNNGRALPHGSCTYVGVGGHGSFGGFGYQSRMWGLLLDTIQSATLVLPNGTVATVSANSYPDLFWAVRGSAPSFGIVYSATYGTFPAPTDNVVYKIAWDASIEDSSKIISAWQAFALMPDLPPTFGGDLNIGTGSGRGHLFIELFCASWGPTDTFDTLIQKFTSQVPATATISEQAKKTTGTWLDALKVIMGGLSTTGPDETDTFYAKSLLTPEASPMTDEAITSFVTYLANKGYDSKTSWFTQVELYGGSQSAVNTPAADSTAFVRRDILFNFQLYASSSNYKPPYPDTGFTFVNGMLDSIVSKEPSDWNYSMYANYVEDRASDWQQRYYGAHYSRLQGLKRSIDPNNVYRFPTSIELESGNSSSSSSGAGSSHSTGSTAGSPANSANNSDVGLHFSRDIGVWIVVTMLALTLQ